MKRLREQNKTAEDALKIAMTRIAEFEKQDLTLRRKSSEIYVVLARVQPVLGGAIESTHAAPATPPLFLHPNASGSKRRIWARIFITGAICTSLTFLPGTGRLMQMWDQNGEMIVTLSESRTVPRWCTRWDYPIGETMHGQRRRINMFCLVLITEWLWLDNKTALLFLSTAKG